MLVLGPLKSIEYEYGIAQHHTKILIYSKFYPLKRGYGVRVSSCQSGTRFSASALALKTFCL